MANRLSIILATVLGATSIISPCAATKTISYKQSSIFTHLPLTLNNNEQGFLLGLNNSIALVSIDGSIKSEYHWKADAETIDICHSVIRESVTECHNLVYIIQPYKTISDKIESYLACGSYASQTKCITLFIKNKRHIVNSVRIGDDIMHKSESFDKEFAVGYFTPSLSTSSIATASYLDKTSGKFQIISASTYKNDQLGTMDARLVKVYPDQLWKNEPEKVVGTTFISDPQINHNRVEFIKVLNHQNKNLVFYSSDKGSFISQVCQNDEGAQFHNYGEDKHSWTSLLQTDLVCMSGETQYKKLVSVGQPFSLGENKLYILAAFTLTNGMDELMKSSVVCVYDMDTILQKLTSKHHHFKAYYDITNHKKGFQEVDSDYDYYPETCPSVEDKVKYSKQAFLQHERLMEVNSGVSSVSNTPVIGKGFHFMNDDIDKFKITSIANMKGGGKVLPFWIGTSDGQMFRYNLKLNEETLYNPMKGVQLVEKIVLNARLNSDSETTCTGQVMKMEVLDEKLLIQFMNCIIPLDIVDCKIHSDCQQSCEVEPFCKFEDGTCTKRNFPIWKTVDSVQPCEKIIAVPEVSKKVEDCTGFKGDCEEKKKTESKVENNSENPTETPQVEESTKMDEILIKSSETNMGHQVTINDVSSAKISQNVILIIAGVSCVAGLLIGFAIRPCLCVKKGDPENQGPDNKTLAILRGYQDPSPRSKSSSGIGSSPDSDHVQSPFSVPLLATDERVVKHKVSYDSQDPGYGTSLSTSQGSQDMHPPAYILNRRGSESSTPGNTGLPGSNLNFISGIPSPGDLNSVPYVPVHLPQPSYSHSKQESNVSKSEYLDKLAPLTKNIMYTLQSKGKASSLDSKHQQNQINYYQQQQQFQQNQFQQNQAQQIQAQQNQAHHNQSQQNQFQQHQHQLHQQFQQSQHNQNRPNQLSMTLSRQNFNSLPNRGRIQVMRNHSFNNFNAAPASSYIPNNSNRKFSPPKTNAALFKQSLAGSNTKLAPVSPQPPSPGGNTQQFHYNTMTLDRRNPRKATIPQLPFFHHQISAPASSVPTSQNTAPSTSSGSSQYSDGGFKKQNVQNMASTY